MGLYIYGSDPIVTEAEIKDILIKTKLLVVRCRAKQYLRTIPEKTIASDSIKTIESVVGVLELLLSHYSFSKKIGKNCTCKDRAWVHRTLFSKLLRGECTSGLFNSKDAEDLSKQIRIVADSAISCYIYEELKDEISKESNESVEVVMRCGNEMVSKFLDESIGCNSVSYSSKLYCESDEETEGGSEEESDDE